MKEYDCRYCSTDYDEEAGGRHRCPEANADIRRLRAALKETLIDSNVEIKRLRDAIEYALPVSGAATCEVLERASTGTGNHQDTERGVHRRRRSRTRMDRRATERAVANAGLMRALGFTVVDAYYLGFMDAKRRASENGEQRR
jgi:hypothetical protein